MPASQARHRATTVTEHRPQGASTLSGMDAFPLVDWAHKIGPSTADLFEKIMASHSRPD